MNHKQIHIQNQRIERISPTHLIIGVDIAKEVHVAHATNYRGIVLTHNPLRFRNSLEGFEAFQNWMHRLLKKHGYTDAIIGMEPTGHYWWTFADHLEEQKQQVALVNPVATKRNKENRDNCPSKSDPKDAQVIADLVSRGYYSEFRPQAASFERLRSLMGEREFWLEDRIRMENRITRWLDIHFPGYDKVFSDWRCRRSVATLKAFQTPSELQGLTTTEVIEQWREQHMQRAGGSRGIQKAAELLAEAKRSVGRVKELEEAKKEIERLVEQYERLENMLQTLEGECKILLEEIPVARQLQSIKGLSTILVGAILAGAGDLKNYAHGNQLLRRAGLNLAECSSGKRKGQITLSKRGDAMLRKYMYLATVQLIGNHSQFRQWHQSNTKEKGMKKHRSLFKLIGKLARIIIGLVQRGETFSSERSSIQEAA